MSVSYARGAAINFNLFRGNNSVTMIIRSSYYADQSYQGAGWSNESVVATNFMNVVSSTGLSYSAFNQIVYYGVDYIGNAPGAVTIPLANNNLYCVALNTAGNTASISGYRSQTKNLSATEIAEADSNIAFMKLAKSKYDIKTFFKDENKEWTCIVNINGINMHASLSNDLEIIIIESQLLMDKTAILSYYKIHYELDFSNLDIVKLDEDESLDDFKDRIYDFIRLSLDEK